MLFKKIPICLTLPEAGNKIPPEFVKHGFAAPSNAILPEYPASAQIFDFTHRMDHIIKTEVPATLLNADAPQDDALPDYLPDGSPIYPGDRRLYHRLRQYLLEEYYKKYHLQIKAAISQPDVKLGIDFHVFSSPEPIICLTNNGDYLGAARFGGGELTCTQEMLRDIRDIVAARFVDTPVRILLNTPIRGGYTIRTYATSRIAWIRVDMAKELMQNADGHISSRRIEILRDGFESVLVLICKLYEWI